MLEVKNLSCRYGKHKILENVSFSVNKGHIVCILGPNGSGKSTLIKSIVGLLIPFKGDVFIDGVNSKFWKWSKRAKKISYIPQTFNSTFQYRAMDIVLMGRTSYIPILSSPLKKDIQIAKESMERLNILHLKDKIYSQMSGGERQLVKIAQALAQQSKIIVMDEPTNNLDFANQNSILNYLKDCSDMGITILMATHYPQQALNYGTKALLVKDKNVVEINKPNKNLTEERLKRLYDMELKLIEVYVEGKRRKICLT
ncbi:MAG: ABC transporter ATP-binding protein [Tissierella sp.]|uniref:ABC transporter ATP-binding protein n=1 Tax=Tissierella sp. TaxID=41274 RepID=UPI003F950BD9